MTEKRRTDFCITCRKDTEYEVRKVTEREVIKEKEYEFVYTKAFCRECGEEMSIPGFLDYHIKERDTQYREAEGIISLDEIRKLMNIYKIGKAPLSLALGFGEVTVSRYLEGQIPSKSYSDIMKKALFYPSYMESRLNENREKVGETAYKKSMKAIGEIKELFRLSDKILASIACIFDEMQEVTPLALQKLLYFIQGIYLALFETPCYPEDCYAWQHGPVFEKVYVLFRDFHYNPIEDSRFSLFRGKDQTITEKEKRVIKLVTATFGRYSGKTLEAITHKERPWQNARTGYAVYEPSKIRIPKEEMKDYFKEMNQIYHMDSVEGLNRYIEARL